MTTNPLHWPSTRAFFRRWQAAQISQSTRAAAMADHPSSQPAIDDDLDPYTRIRRTCSVCFGELVITNPNTGAEYPCACRTGLEKDRIERKAFGS